MSFSNARINLSQSELSQAKNTGAQAEFSKFELVVMEADIIRGRETTAQQQVKSDYQTYAGNGVALLLEAVEYGIEGESLDARIEKWRADVSIEGNINLHPKLVEKILAAEPKAELAVVTRQLAKLGKAYSNRKPTYRGSKYFFYLEQTNFVPMAVAPHWNTIRWQQLTDESKVLFRSTSPKALDIREQWKALSKLAIEIKTSDSRFTPGWTKEALAKYDALYFQLVDKYPGLPKGLPSIDWAIRHKVNFRTDLTARFAGSTTPQYLGDWRKPEALRIARSQAWVMVKNGEMEGKAEYLAKLSQYDVHPEFGPWIERWLDTHQPINRSGLGYGVKFEVGHIEKPDGQVTSIGFVTQSRQPWKIPVPQVVEHWASDARLYEFTACTDKRQFAQHCKNFWLGLWDGVNDKWLDSSRVLVLLPQAVYDYARDRLNVTFIA